MRTDNVVIAFTGHRPAKLQDGDEKWLRDELFKVLQIIVEDNKGQVTFISGGALGFDTVVAEEVLEIREGAEKLIDNCNIKLWFYLPFPDYRAKWPADLKARFDDLLNQADKVIDVNPNPYQVWKYHRRNQSMVDKSNLLIACWDGSTGGTYETVQYAMRMGKPVLILNPRTKSIYEINAIEVTDSEVIVKDTYHQVMRRDDSG